MCADLRQQRERAFRVVLRSLPEKPAESFLHHVIFIGEECRGHAFHVIEVSTLASSTNERYGGGTTVPTVWALGPAECGSGTRFVSGDHRAEEVMHQAVVVSPTAYSIEP